jgi:ketosteroid isomerase-like protein
VKLLGGDYASVIGQFHLKRTAAGGGDTSGVFSLLFHQTGAGWRIVLDHTS